jgi:Zn-dependent protease with chaperone function
MSEMTATRIGRPATLLLLGAGWIVAALLLLRTTVPHLDLDGLDVHRYFSAAELARAHRYERFVRINWVLGLAVELAVLVLLVRRAPRMVRGMELGPVSAGIVVGMVTLVTLYAVQLPFGFVDQWWAERHGLATNDYLSWLIAPWAEISALAVYAMATIAIVMGLARWLGERWWIAAAPLFIVIVGSFALLFGWLSVVDTKPVPAGLRDDVAALERTEHVTGTPVRVDTVSDYTSQVNAFTAGFGPSTRVVLWDTLLDGRFSDREVRAVIAHELGHVRHHHVLKGLAWFALLAFPLTWAIARATRSRGGMGSPAAVPVAVLTVVVFGVVTAPLQNVVSRRYEAEADWAALAATRDPAAVRDAFRQFTETSLAEPNPPTWDYLFLETHPTIAQRIAMAEAWRKREAAGR